MCTSGLELQCSPVWLVQMHGVLLVERFDYWSIFFGETSRRGCPCLMTRRLSTECAAFSVPCTQGAMVWKGTTGVGTRSYCLQMS